MPLNSYGGFWGALPQSTGRYFFVSAGDTYTLEGRVLSASDAHDGTDPRRALRRINQAWANRVSANAGDVIVLLHGTHTPADVNGVAQSIPASVAGVHMTGLPSGFGNELKPKSVIGAVTALNTITVTAADITISHLNIIPVTTKVAVTASVAADGLNINNCYFDLNTPAVNTGTKGITMTGAASRVMIRNNVFEADGAQGPAIDMTATLNSRVENNKFILSAGTWAVSMLVGAATAQLEILDNEFFGAGTQTAAISGTGATITSGVFLSRNRFGVLCTVPIDNFSAVGLTDLVLNYVSTVGGGGGGTLVSANT